MLQHDENGRTVSLTDDKPVVLITCYVLDVTYLLVPDNILWTSIIFIL